MKLKIRLRNAVPGPLSPVALPWLEDSLQDSVTSLGEYVDSLISDQIRWYYRKKKWPSRFSRSLRMASLALLALGAAVPVLSAAVPGLAGYRSLGEIEFGHLGYLLLACAAACLRGRSPSTGELENLVRLCRETVVLVRTEVERETMEWVAEFQSNLAHMEQELRQRSQRKK